MRQGKRLFLLIFIMAGMCMIVTSVTIATLYRTALNEESARLLETVQSQARLIVAVARFAADHQKRWDPHVGTPEEATLNQIIDAHKHYKGFGETGEFTLAQKEGNTIVFLLSHRHSEVNKPKPVSFDSKLTEPMRLALSGKSGTLIGLDYRGETVLAAYEPVEDLNAAIVAKIDLTEIRAPFIRAGVISGLVAILAILLGAGLFFKVTKPMIRSLVESEEKYRALFERSLELVYLCDFEGNFIEANDTALQSLGYTREDIRSLKFSSLLDNDQLSLAFETVEEILKTGSQKEVVEYKLRRKDGSYIHVESGAVIIYREGKPYAIQGIARNITDRKLAEEALRESEERFRRYFELGTIGMAITSPEQGWVEVNDRICEILGYSREELSQKNWAEITHPDDLQADVAQFNRVLSGEIERYSMDKRFIRKDGEIIYANIGISCVRKGDGEVDFVTGFLNDLSERVKAEKGLRESEDKYRNILENMEEGYYEVDLAGNFTFFNDAMCKIGGYSTDELMGMNNRQYMDPETAQKVYKAYNEVYRTGKPAKSCEYEGIRKDGTRGYIEISASLLKDSEGKPIGFRGIVRDISERRQAEEERARLESQLQQARKMEAIGLLAGGVAHDLNNILSGIVSYPDLLLLDLPKDSPIRRPIEVIKESGQRAADVVSDLLTVARGVASAREVSNLNSLVQEYLGSPEHKRLESMRPSIDFETVPEPDLLNINCSPVHIKKTLMNLVINASEAIEGIGTVTISTMNRYLDGPLKGYEDVRIGEYAVLSVSDDGSGISPEDLERIFEPFYTKKVMGRRGTGLGLTVVWNTVQDHNGYINVRSSEKGTVFELYFPVSRERVVAEKEEVPLEDYLGHGEKMLVVDDEERQREIACGLLSKLGYTAEAVSSGGEAIEYVKEHPVDLVVLDMIMPKGINGRETYEEIIKIRPGQKAIIASGFSETEDIKIAQSLGAGKYIKKPYTLEKIGIAVKEELGK